MTAVIIYVRKSNAEVEQRSLDQQETDLRAHAGREGWDVVAVLRETQSAYADRERPSFNEAMELAEEHEGVLLVWALDRFSRQGAESVLRLFPRSGKSAPFRLVGASDGTDTADPARRFETVLRAELAMQESERIGSRVRRARSDARSRGLWASGNAPYGYRVEGLGNERRLVIVAEHSAVVQRMAADVVAGTPLREVARRLNHDGILSPQGKAWHPQSVRAILTNPATAGYLPRGTRGADTVAQRVRCYVTDDAGAPVRASWGGVLTEKVWAETIAVLLNGKSRAGRPSKVTETPLLRGLLKCSGCGRSMAAQRYKARVAYTCGNPNPTGQKHVNISMAVADDVVTRAVLSRLAVLADADPLDPLVSAVSRRWLRQSGADGGPTRTTVEATAADIREAIGRTARMVAEGLVDDDTGTAMLTEYKAKLAAAEEALSELRPEDAAPLGWLGDLAAYADDPTADPIGPGSLWYGLDREVQRSVISAVVNEVRLLPSPSSRPSHDQTVGRFEINWTAD